MDPITHGIAGALIGKGFFSEKYGPTAVFAVTLGSVFPDVDVVADLFSNDPLATIRFHRGFTHSFLALPIFTAALAALLWWWQRRRGKSPSGFWILFAAFAAGIASHILLDATTSYGTRIWNPFSSHRYAWDWMFILDFTLTALLLLPQVAAWVYANEKRIRRRAIIAWTIFAATTFGVWSLATAAGYPFGVRWDGVILLLMAMFFFLPMWRHAGLRLARAQWCRGGFYVALAYILTCATAHSAALAHVREFAQQENLAVVNEAAIPLPPNLLHWDGMIRTAGGVYRARFALGNSQTPLFNFLADSPPSPVLSQALALPEVRTYLWFARFPVIRTSTEKGNGVVEFLDIRFAMRRPSAQPPPFTFRVVMDPQGRVVDEEWAVAASPLRIYRNEGIFHPQRVTQ
jgi:membrane-bound metal-dependent hydrolase YbcI (DUF457 family)